MTQSLFWKEKVVSKLTITALLLSLSSFAFSQAAKAPTAFDGKITLQQGSMHFDDLINKLSSITGLNFIYSANKIETKRMVAISYNNSTLDEVFLKLGRQMNLTFKRRDSYVIILKKATAPKIALSQPSPVLPGNTPRHIPAEKYTDGVVAFAAPSLPLTQAPEELLSREYFKKRLHHYFDTSLLQKVPVSELRKINVNNRHRGWFFSGGMTVNNYSAGPEMQFGIRSFYVTLGKRFLKSSNMTVYGLGTSFLLSRNFSFNPTYSHGVIKQSTSMVFDQKGIAFGSRLKVTEHQLRLMIQYSLDEKVNLRFGPTLSHLALKRLTYFRQSFETMAMIAPAVPAGGTRFEYNYQYDVQPAQPVQSVKMLAIYSEENYTRIGWEVGVAFRLNFFQRR